MPGQRVVTNTGDIDSLQLPVNVQVGDGEDAAFFAQAIVFPGGNVTQPSEGVVQVDVGGGGSGITLTDGTHTVDGATTVTVDGLVVGGTSPNATLTSQLGVTTQTETTYTLAASDANGWSQQDNADAITVTIPANAGTPLPVGEPFALEQTGAGAVTVVGAGGVTLNYYSPSSAGSCVSIGQFSVIQLVQTATDVWTAAGGVA